jgi:hypothetical protein
VKRLTHHDRENRLFEDHAQIGATVFFVDHDYTRKVLIHHHGIHLEERLLMINLHELLEVADLRYLVELVSRGLHGLGILDFQVLDHVDENLAVVDRRQDRLLLQVVHRQAVQVVPFQHLAGLVNVVLDLSIDDEFVGFLEA